MKSPSPRKSLDLERLFADFRIEHENSGTGWIQLSCPLCEDTGQHLGWNTKSQVFNCFRCGRNSRFDVLSALLNLSPRETSKVISRYEGNTRTPLTPSDAVQDDTEAVLELKMPYGTAKMTDRHREYLRTRHFDPSRLETEWGLLGTGVVGPFAHRIIIPVVQNGKLVCFQGRDISGKATNKYKSCPDDKAVFPIKTLLYGIDKVRGDSVVATEGPTKVWRLGAGSVCTFGATVTNAQVKLFKRFRRVFLLFDEDEAGLAGAEKVGKELAVFGMNAVLVTTGIRDVAELSDGDARGLMVSLLN